MINGIETSPVVRAARSTVLPVDASTNVDGLEIGVLTVSETSAAVGVVARGMRDNPMTIAAFGADPESRMRNQYRLMAAAFAVKDFSHTLVARRPDGTIVGVCGMMLPGDCLPTLGEHIRLIPRLLPMGPRALGRVLPWLGAWAKHDPKERHWHVGPVAVDSHLQGQGIGSKLLRVFCAQMDAAGEDAYLETDKPINVTFYQRFGFTLIREAAVLGVPNWFMLRRANARHR